MSKNFAVKSRSNSTSIPCGIAVEKFEYILLIGIEKITLKGKKCLAVRSTYLITLIKAVVRSRSISKVSKTSQ
jgi:hypothetical protein